MKSVISIKKVAGVVLILLMISACTEHFDELNTRHDLVTEDILNTDLLLTYVQYQAWIYYQDGGMGTIGNYPGMSVSLSNCPFCIQNMEPNTFIWNAAYDDLIMNLADLIRILEKRDDEAGTTDNDNRIAVARILKTLIFAKVTDTYGDVPYFESCLPQEIADYTPRYDTQKDIYIDFFKELREAAAQLDENKGSYGNADLIYGGDVTKWRKLANSHRLRLALRVRYVDEDLAQNEMSDLNESNLITNAEDNAFINTADDLLRHTNPNYRRRFSGLNVLGSDLTKEFAAKTMIDLWQDNFDPRLRLFCDTAEAAWPGTPGYDSIEHFGYRGYPLLGSVPVEEKYPYGLESCSRWSLHMYAPVWPHPILSSQEVYFAMAEAALFNIKGSAADAQRFYEKGVKAALDWAVSWNDLIRPQLAAMFQEYRPDWTAEQVEEYAAFHDCTQEKVDAFSDTAAVMTLKGTVEEQHEMIMNQKIAGYYPIQIWEGWFEWRRTGYPRVLVGSDGAELQGVSPRRSIWPQSEQELNADNYYVALQRIGGYDHPLVKVWWDTNPDAPHEHPGKVEWMDQPWVKVK
jgi:hypothetical protein